MEVNNLINCKKYNSGKHVRLNGLPSGKRIPHLMDTCNAMSIPSALLTLPTIIPRSSVHLTNHRNITLLESNIIYLFWQDISCFALLQ